ncbi:MAG: efflux RND transporter periplasmic adaptor subunit [Burkholderiaceae bacterium]
MTTTSHSLIGIGAFVIGTLALNLPSSVAQSRVSSDRPVKLHATPLDTKSTKASASAASAPEVIGCLIEPRISSQVAASSPGTLAEVKVDRGDRVTKGQVLAILDRDVEQALLASARSRAQTQSAMKAARATRNMAYHKLSRIRKLDALSYGSKLELELAAGELSVAEARLEQAQDEQKSARQDHVVAQTQLARRQVVSPIDGIVADRLLNPGERADGRTIVRIVQLDTLRVEVILPASQFGMVKQGMSGEVLPEIASAGSVVARVEQVDPFIDAASGTFRARLSMDNADLQIPAGIRCSIQFAEADKRPREG